MTVLNDAENTLQERVHNQVQPMTETFGNFPQENQEIRFDNSINPHNFRNLPEKTEPCLIQDKLYPLGPAGLEPATNRL